MGVVYEAVQDSLARRVALKILPAERGRGLFLEPFQAEARSVARLHHINIVAVFGVDPAGDTHFYGMQYIGGRGLACLLEGVRRRRNYPGQSPPYCALRSDRPKHRRASLRASVSSDVSSDRSAQQRWHGESGIGL
jgi:serine/threonine protein kinase